MKLQAINKAFFLGSLFFLASISGQASSETLLKSPLSSKPQNIFHAVDLEPIHGPAMISKFNLLVNSASGRMKAAEAVRINDEKLHLVDGSMLQLGDGFTVAVNKEAGQTVMSFEHQNGLTLEETKSFLLSLTYQDTRALGKDKYRSYLEERHVTLQLVQ